jgi:hypothetical protein
MAVLALKHSSVTFWLQGNLSVINSMPNPMFMAHPNLSDDVNRNIIQSEVEGGVLLNSLPPSTVLQIETQNHRYTAVLLGGSEALISGHPEFCPEPVLVAISGSTWGGTMLKQCYIGRGMHLEFCHPAYRTPIVTSCIQDIREERALLDASAGQPSLAVQPQSGADDACPYD